MKTLAIIGSTGSIGLSSLNIFKKNKKNLKLVYLAAHSNLKKLQTQVKKYKPQKYFLLSENMNSKLPKELDKLDNILKNKKKIDYVISGMSGYDALNINFKLVKIAKNLLIANKETIICGGHIFLNYAKKNNCNIIPIDSEHYCLHYFFKNFKLKKLIDKVFLVASGGPFFNKKINYNEKISKVIKHPIWSMGKKISIDSSNFSNKVLELFEAKILFKIPSSKIKIIVEQTSHFHAIIKLKNKLYFPILHFPKMELPISDAMNQSSKIDFNIYNVNTSLRKPDTKKFPIIKLGYEILNKTNHAGMILFTVFNERLGKMYLNNQIKYGDISKILVKLFRKKNVRNKSQQKIKTKSDIKSFISYAQNLKIL